VDQEHQSSGGWRNARFKALAEELAIEVTNDPRIGWSPTTLPATTTSPPTNTSANCSTAGVLVMGGSVPSHHGEVPIVNDPAELPIDSAPARSAPGATIILCPRRA